MGEVNSSRPDGDRSADLVAKGKRPGLWITVTQSTNNGLPDVLGTYQVPWEKRAIPATKVIKRAPGCWILKVADFLCSPATVQNVYEAAVADLRHEYCEALREGRPGKARVAQVRGYAGLIVTVLSHWLGRLLRLVKAGKSLMG